MKLIVLMSILACLLFASGAQAKVKHCEGYYGRGTLTDTAITTSPTDSEHTLDVGRKYHALVVCFKLNSGSGTIELQNSIDGGSNYDTVNGTSTTASECYVVDNPMGQFKARTTACTSCNWTVSYHCGASAGGRP